MLKAIIFDVDGTLIDSVDAHAEAWRRAFAEHGVDLGYDEVRSQIGNGGDQLLPVFLPDDEVDGRGNAIDEQRAAIVKAEKLDGLQAFPQVRALFERAMGAGLTVTLASSAKGDELEVYKRKADIKGLVAEQTSSDDAEKSKPYGNIFQAALDLLPGIATVRLWSSETRPTMPRRRRRSGCAPWRFSAAALPRAICEPPAPWRSSAIPLISSRDGMSSSKRRAADLRW